MQTCMEVESTPAVTQPSWAPICCQHAMEQIVRRAILHSDGSVVYCGVWNCGACGRLLL